MLWGVCAVRGEWDCPRRGRGRTVSRGFAGCLYSPLAVVARAKERGRPGEGAGAETWLGEKCYSQNSFVRPTRDCVPVFW